MIEQQYILTHIGEEQSFSLLQITDMHLFEKDESCLLGVNTAKSFEAVLEQVKKQDVPFDLILATGDIAQDYSEGAYACFARMVKPLNKPVFWLPGNHDDGPKMTRVMPTLDISDARNIIVGKWQFIMLDTQVYNSPLGWIDGDDLSYIQKCVESRPDLNTVICLHHNAFTVNSAWLDQHELKNKIELLSLIHKYKNVKLVLCGHIHQEQDFIDAEGIRFISTPSTCIQFAPLSFNFALDTKGPGWRYLTFNPDGTISTQVYRLPYEDFKPDFGIGGY